MYKKAVLVLMLCSCIAAMAQEQADVPQQPGDSEVEVKVIDCQKELGKIRRKIRKQGMTSVRCVDIGCAPLSRDYVLNRRMAFEQAEFLAKQEIAKSFQQKVSSAMAGNSVESHAGLKASDLEGDATAVALINRELNKELEAMGIDRNDQEAVKKAISKVKGTDSFKKRIEIASQAYLIGVSAYASASSKDKVGVLIYSSETLRDIASGMLSGNIKKYAPGISVDDYFEAVEENLANTYGVRVMIDENGDPCLVAFAQREILTSEDSAVENAGDAATAMIREFVGTSVMLKKAEESNRTMVYLEPVDSTDNKAVATATAEVRKNAMAEAEAIDFSGIEELDSGIIRLPSGDKIAWAVKYWTPRTATAAAQAHAQGEKQRQVVQQGAAVSGRKPAPVRRPVTPAARKGRKNLGSEGVSAGVLPAL
ncbi:MAG: hypothetical protein E7058_06465 [Lentisphaerae bacterium]|nr:hypothetical protein [Lentisphaerota bacterium]